MSHKVGSSIADFHCGDHIRNLGRYLRYDAAYTRWRRDVRAAVLPIFLNRALLPYTRVGSGTVKPPLFKPLRERGAHGFSLPHSKKIAPTPDKIACLGSGDHGSKIPLRFP